LTSVGAGGLAVAGTINCAGSINAVVNVTANNFINNTANSSQTVQVVNAGVAVNGAAFGTGVILEMPLTTIFPQSANFKSYRIFMSGASNDVFATISGVANGQGGAGQYFGQFQTATGAYSAYANLKGNLQAQPIQVPASPGGITMTPDSIEVSSAYLVNNTLFYCVVANNGATIAFNTAGCNVWLRFVGIL
jgi:hypothetical protein